MFTFSLIPLFAEKLNKNDRRQLRDADRADSKKEGHRNADEEGNARTATAKINFTRQGRETRPTCIRVELRMPSRDNSSIRKRRRRPFSRYSSPDVVRIIRKNRDRKHRAQKPPRITPGGKKNAADQPRRKRKREQSQGRIERQESPSGI